MPLIASDTTEITSEEAVFMRQQMEKNKQFHIETDNHLTLIAHRGMGPTSLLGDTFPKDFLPENTIRAFKQAMLLGADGIELDIFKAQDHTLMVVHDDELWRNQYEMPRDASSLPSGESKESYIVGKKNKEELKTLSMGPSGEKMPELREVFDLTREANKIRIEAGLPPIILNIELKDASAKVECLDLIENYIKENPKSGVDFDSICFCSFNHACLIALKEDATQRGIDNIQIAPGIKTSTIYGEENVDKKTFSVKPGAVHSEDGLNYLKNLVEKNNFTAYDGILFDMGDGLIQLASKGKKQVHASTSDFRAYEADIEFAVYLYKMSKIIPTYFKCDEIEKAMELFLRIAKQFKELDTDRLTLNQENELKTPDLPLGYLVSKKPSESYSQSYKRPKTTTPPPQDDSKKQKPS